MVLPIQKGHSHVSLWRDLWSMTPGVYNLPVVDVYPQMESAVWLAMMIYMMIHIETRQASR